MANNSGTWTSLSYIHFVCLRLSKKKKKEKVKKYMGRIYYSPWNESFFLCVAVASVTTGRAIFAGHPAPRTVVNFGEFRDFCSWAIAWRGI